MTNTPPIQACVEHLATAMGVESSINAVAQRLAETFVEILREEHGDDVIRQIAEANARTPNQPGCASADHCDPVEIMHRAFIRCGAFFEREEDCDCGTSPSVVIAEDAMRRAKFLFASEVQA